MERNMIPFARVLKYGNVAPDLKQVKKMAIMNSSTLFILYQNGDLYARGSDANVFPTGLASPFAFQLIRQNVEMFYCAYGDRVAMVITTDNRWWHIGNRACFTGTQVGSNTTWSDETANLVAYPIDTVADVKDIMLTSYGMIYLLKGDAGNTYVRGYSNYDEIGTTKSRPNASLMFTGVESIFASSNVTCWVMKDGRLLTGGYNAGGQLGRSTGAANYGAPAQCLLNNVRDVVTTGVATYAITKTNVSYVCGGASMSTGGSGGAWTATGTFVGNLIQSGRCGSNSFGYTTAQNGLYSMGQNLNYSLGTGDLNTHYTYGRYATGAIPQGEVEWVASVIDNGTFAIVDGKLYACGNSAAMSTVFGVESTTFIQINLP